MYHYVRDLKNSRFPGIKGLDLDLFREQIQYLRKHYHIITMEEVIHSIDNQAKIPRKSVLLTFDDAYSDHYMNVFPILDKYQLQGSFYTPSKAVSEHTVLDVNKIHFILASVQNKLDIVSDLKNLLKVYKKEYQLQDFDYYYKKLACVHKNDTQEVIFIKRLLQVELIEELRIRITDTLFEKYVGMSEPSFSRELYMNEEQLKHMLRSGQHIGNHGYNHYWWNSLTKEEMKEELDLSIAFLNKIGVDMDNWTACYPYGSSSNQVVQALSNLGCKVAFSTEMQVANLKHNHPLLIPRLDTNDLPKSKDSLTNEWYKN